MTTLDGREGSSESPAQAAAGWVVSVWRDYKAAILLTTTSALILYVVCAAGVWLLSPQTKTTRLSFGMEFRGAERGENPNGTKFSPTEVVATPVLLSVYRANRLDKFMPFPTFKSSIAIIAANETLESLIREYREKLAQRQLTQVERAQLEQEFEERKASLSQAEFALLLVTDRTHDLTPALRSKILTDVLTTWAERAVREKGVALYDVPTLSAAVFDDVLLAGDSSVASLDLTRTKVDAVLDTVAQLRELPGARLVRTDRSAKSLVELEQDLTNLLRFELQPRILSLVASDQGTTEVTGYLQSQLSQLRLELSEAEGRIEAVRATLRAYTLEREQKPYDPTGADGKPKPPASEVVPQVNDSFLRQVAELSSERDDLLFRQSLTRELMRVELQAVPLRAEVAYYESLLRGTAIAGAAPSGGATPTRTIVEHARKATAELTLIYRKLSENLNPSSELFSIRGPASSEINRSVQPRVLILGGLLIFFLVVPLAFAGGYIHSLMSRRLNRGESNSSILA